jgi:hypothetical protein
MTRFKKGDLVRSVGEDWANNYLDKIFLVIDVDENDIVGDDLSPLDGESILILLDHIGSGTIRAYPEEVVKV